ncbi:protein Son isoform X2 [Aphidius gifuensis]|uniref:protein Son isoform X2 n=1 Tax=Aphidius gifuensis TaxID=684658 RepID=UPI001CDB9298|nr:protein Son isoform X2 [Aphidius gifuensis]
MASLFDIENLITHVGPDAVKIKQEPGLPEKSSNEILTELFSTFDTDAEASTDSKKSDDDNDDDNKSKKKKKKSKKKHKHKDKKHKKKDKKNSTESDTEADHDGLKRKKKHNKKLKRKRNSSDSQDSDELKIKIKKEPIDVPVVDSSENQNIDNFEKFDIPKRPTSPVLPSVLKKNNDDNDETIIPRLLEKSDQSIKQKILIKDLKNSVVYNKTVEEVENKEKEKAARIEDGEITDSENNDRTPTLSPSPSRDSYDIPGDSSFSWSRMNSQSPKRKDTNDLRYVLKKKEKLKKLEEKKGSRSNNYDDDNDDEYDDIRRSRKDRSRSSSRHKKKSKKSRSHERENHRTKSNERRRDRSCEKRSTRSRDRSRYSTTYYRNNSEDRSWDRYSRGRSRSTERRERIEIDKKKLLEIARKNAITMIKRGTLPLAQQDKAIAAIQAGGKSVDELIDFCKSLSKSEALGELSSVSSDEGGGSDTGRNFHHPFLLKERPNSIVMNIRDSKQIPTKTFQERTTESSTTLRLQFPVSSGQQHRKTENEWVEVVPTPPVQIEKPKPKKPFVPASTPTPTPQKFEIIPPVNFVDNNPMINSQILPVPAPMPVTTFPTPASLLPGPSVFPQPVAENVDIGSIVSQRLAAMRKLQDNPNDVQALNQMYHAQNGMKYWAESKQMPGQFTGSTGAKVLTPAELTSGYQAWARKTIKINYEESSAAV